ncbi:uncharacterized protein LOC105398533 [Plutella xylostella]|uniref:uncharacterized protein LOC105398533 n=1 Tax=Plutella xylostella TaxID=51655 RepID=UPI002032F2BC|nr:uncharacterized protein LOC105398533 [Plutella xylostella]
MASSADVKTCSICLKASGEDSVCPDCKGKPIACLCCGSTSDHKGKITELPPRPSTEQDGGSTSDNKDKGTAPPGFNMEKVIADAVTKMLSQVMETHDDMTKSKEILARFSANIKKYMASYEVLNYRVINLEARVAALENPVDPMSPEEEHAMIPSDADDDNEDAIVIEYPEDL